MINFLELLATLSCAVFFGAAIYINLVEHPARMSCGVAVALSQWAPSYKRATVMQASLAIIGFLSSLVAWFLGADRWILIAGIFLGTVAPFTLIFIMPTNNRLSTLSADKNSDEALLLLTRWNLLHAVRTMLSFIALMIFLLHIFLLTKL